MHLHAWHLLVVALVAQCCKLSVGEHQFAKASDLHSNYPSSASLCGENLTKETGMLNGLYYVFYETSVTTKLDIPVILWLSGGPGCSGLVALLFENGPCSFDDEAGTISFNPYSWTGLAHVIYLDQPKGTGYSDGDNGVTNPWSLEGAADDMRTFLQQFYLQHPNLKANDFYVFGESYAGHYVPDLAVRLLNEDSSLPKLKGIAIGNGVVSTTAWVDSVIPFFKSSEYGYDFLGSNEENIRTARDRFVSAIARCRRGNNLRHIPTEGANSDCIEALQSLSDFEGATVSSVWGIGRNVYDMRRKCHLDDALQLCYRFSRLQTFVNSPNVSVYFDDVPHEWSVCSSGALPELATMDKLEESESNVAQALEHGVRVLVYGGDSDTVVNWMSQDTWTRVLTWKYQAEFNSASFIEHKLHNQPIGRVRSSHGLSFMKVYNAGHMVPHDQPAVAYEIVRSFLYDTQGVGMFS
ncbi:Serine protease family S10 [Phytophthora palmivora]|uniref:Carboxypeptidase n=1 Tax=Phytophthora palmivora TaxID=4796 RepID=A0A2P4X9P5_9STRA|nr:Serine protease family S10 [Phytophthora palmivora]